MTRQKWVLEPHLCSSCGGRILLCVEGNGMTPGGNQIRRCADCGVSTTNAHDICWCGVSHKGNNSTAYCCLPFAILEKEPWLEEGFRACGCDPSRGDVGIMLRSDLVRLRTQPPKESKIERAQRLLNPLYEALRRVDEAPGREKSLKLEAMKMKLDFLKFTLESTD